MILHQNVLDLLEGFMYNIKKSISGGETYGKSFE